MSYLREGRFQESEDALTEVLTYSRSFGTEIIGSQAYAYLGVITIFKGHMSQGLRMLEESIRVSKEKENRLLHSVYEVLLGIVYLQIVQGEGERDFSSMFKNIGFLLRNLSFAAKKAEDHFSRAIEIAEQIGAKGIQGLACLNLGLLHKAKKRTERARHCLTEAVQLFEECQAETRVEEAKGILASLE